MNSVSTAASKQHRGIDADRIDNVLIVGTGHAGAQTAVVLRQLGHVGPISLLGDEPDLPYERPPLSKDYLLGKRGLEAILLRPAGFWKEQSIDLLPGHKVTAVDPASRCVTTSGGNAFGYDALVWAAGARPLRLRCPGSDLLGVHVIRTRMDVDCLRAELAVAGRIAVVGGGYIGLECAAALRDLGKQVTLLEALPRVLARVAGEALAKFFEREHRARGVDLRLDAKLEAIEGMQGRVAGVRLGDGETIACDLVIVGIGVAPCVEPLVAAGASGENGVEVDDFCRTSLDRIFAVGDCAMHPNAFAGGARIRLESVQNANDQAGIAARAITGAPTPYRAVPWFWSHQYDLRLQTVGLSRGHDQAILRGDPASRSFSVIYLRGGKVIALDCVNATKDYALGRKLVETAATMDPAQLADPNLSLRRA